MAGRNMKLKAIREVVKAIHHHFTAAIKLWEVDYIGSGPESVEGWKFVLVGGYKYVWSSPCGRFVAKHDRQWRAECRDVNGAVAEAECYATIPVKHRALFPVTLRAGKLMTVQNRGIPGPVWGLEGHSADEIDDWFRHAQKMKHTLYEAGLYNFDVHAKNLARFGSKYKLVDFATTHAIKKGGTT